jgi:UDP-glucose 4-epimerase
MMKILVTGGAGFVGTNLIKRLLDDGHKVVSLDNYSTGKEENEIDHKNVTYFNVDLRDAVDFDFFMEKPDLIYHLAALPRIQPSFEFPAITFEANVLGTLNLLEWVRNKEDDIPIVYAGSSSFHGGVYKNPYTFTKWQGEEVIQMYNKLFDLPMAICRFYNVYGPHQLTEGEYCTVIGIFETQYKNGDELTITGDGEQRRDFTHVYDIVDGLVKCGDALVLDTNKYKVNGQIFELGRGENYSINVVAQSFDWGYTYIPERPGEVKETLCTDTTAKELLDWNPTIDLLDYIEGVRGTNEG